MFHSLKLTANKGKQILKQGITKDENETPNCIPASAHSYELLSPALFTSWAFSVLICESGTVKWGLLLPGHCESQDAPPTLDPDLLHSGGAPACSVGRRGQAGFAEPSGHQLGSVTAHFPWLPVPWWRSPWGAGLDPEGAKALRGRETTNFTRWEFKRK